MPSERPQRQFNLENYSCAREDKEGRLIPIKERLDRFIGLLEFLAQKSPAFSDAKSQKILVDLREEHEFAKLSHLSFFLDHFRIATIGATREEISVVIKSLTIMFEGIELPYEIGSRMHDFFNYCLGRFDAVTEAMEAEVHGKDTFEVLP